MEYLGLTERNRCLIFIFLIIVIGCSDNGDRQRITNSAVEDSTIYVNLDDNVEPAFTMDEVIAEAIQLETNEDNIIGSFRKLIEWKSKYWILDEKLRTITSFFKNGSFAFNLTSAGAGPGELVHPRDIYINEGSGELCVVDTDVKKLKYYDSAGVFINEKQPDYYTFNVAIQSNNNYLLNYGYQYNGKDYLLVYDSKFESLKNGYFNPMINTYGNVSNPNLFSTYSADVTYLNMMFDNEIYQLNGDLRPFLKWKFDFGPYSLTKDEKLNSDIYELETIVRNRNIVYHITNFKRLGEDILYVEFRWGNDNIYSFFNIEDNTFRFFDKLMIDDYELTICGFTKSNQLIGFISPELLANGRKKSGYTKGRPLTDLKNLLEVDYALNNPVLFIINTEKLEEALNTAND